MRPIAKGAPVLRLHPLALFATLAGALLALAAAGCTPNAGGGGGGGDDDDTPLPDEWEQRLNDRILDYGAALRTASLKLVGDLPTLEEIKAVENATDKKATYEGLIRGYLDDPRFEAQARAYWRNTFKIGDPPGGDGGEEDPGPMLDSAPLFATMLTLENRSYLELFTATSGTCPRYMDDGTGTGTMVLTAQDCANNAPAQAGVLTNPGLMRHYYSNLAFRRTRFVQEIFDCTAFPAEVTSAQDVGGLAKYTSPWPFESIADEDTGGRIKFRDVSAVICANCHSTMNHIAPLFGRFDQDGMWSDQFEVYLPTDGTPRAELTDWLPAGEVTAWRLDQPAANLTELGQRMAEDPAIAHCAVARVWNWALGKDDIVSTLSIVPEEVIADQVATFAAGGYKMKDMLFAVFTSDDFVKF
jgi:hypothetical protein